MATNVSTGNKILKFIQKNQSATGPELAEHLGITRQAVSQHLQNLIAEGGIFKTGSTRGARYFPIDSAPDARRIKRELALANLDEAEVYENVATTLGLSQLSSNVESILNYGFTEILNNAIDHSMSDRCNIEVQLDATRISFNVTDGGIGVFHSIEKKFDLDDEHAAMIELVKGKTTTKPEAHTGEGIFFVSKSADRFILRSHRLQIEWDRDRNDVFVSNPRFVKGTRVNFELRLDSRSRLENVFAEFAPQEYDYQFQKTRVFVKLVRKDYVSRSEAKRLMHNLDKFQEIELDFRDVQRVGQGFADEVFRVFTSIHPNVIINTKNASGAVEAMIQHVSINN